MAHRGEERALGLVGLLGRLARLARRPEQAGVVDGDRGLLGEPDEEVEVGLAERIAGTGPPDREQAADTVPADQRRGHDPLVGDVLGAGDLGRPRIANGVVDELGRAAGGEVADDALARRGSGRP